MCGVCGIVDFDETPDLDLVRAMTRRLHHRGPDGHGHVRDESAVLGHSRLSIVDVAGSAQPMSNEDGQVWVSFNGEIFNYLELRAQLSDRGHRFRTDGDTEVIVHAWEEWGEGCFDRFNGQWALAVWDRRDQRLVLSRDRLGVRPLYFHQRGRRLAFASEVKALFADPRIPREIDPIGMDQTLTFWSTVAPRTVFREVDQVAPGTYCIFDRSGLRRGSYWQPSFPERGSERVRDLDASAALLRERVVEAVRLRFLRSDVPVAGYLSGGIDSAVSAAVMARYTDAPLHTFSLRFEDAEFDEGRYQRLMVDRLRADHSDVVVSGADVAAVFPDVVAHSEAPLLRAAPAPMFILSRLVRDHGYKVVITGEGADEMLGGYDLFREARVRQFWTRDPASLKRSAAADLLYPWMNRSPGQAPAFARSFFARHLDAADPALSHRPRWDSTSALKSMLTLDQRAAALDHDASASLVAAMPPESAGWDPLSRAQWLERATLLPGYILASQGDRMLMANSVEGRFPFLDRHVVELTDGLPGWHKLFGLQEKYVLKKAFGDLVPDEVLHRPKQPYRAPDAACFFHDGAPSWIGDVTSPHALRECGVFEPEQVAHLFAKAARNGGSGMSNTDNMRVLAVLSTQLLHQQLIVDAGSGGSPAHVEEPSVALDLRETQGSPA
jgi:asparagine synthase (glutamine-hydrolysing)